MTSKEKEENRQFGLGLSIGILIISLYHFFKDFTIFNL